MTGSLTTRPATPEDAVLLERLWLLFRHEMSGLTGTLPNPDGTFRRERLDAALTDPGRLAVLARATPRADGPGGHAGGPRPVGFALVRDTTAPTRVLNSFFVVRGARRSGVGRRFAAEVLALFPGPWEIAFQDTNTPAVHFWRAVATDAAGDAWTEERRSVPGRPDLSPDTWISFTTSR
ncbi:GNAT family N-acetyltransferase [Myceligenerans sp. TRM 65318]|uniref:GNAT family N-acetyltransferase n=1 Tax=Myceligenerans pegani TaxID=2776917 RepID=A0ABR9MZP2_9MICO|nr:GNAT family N-acetyltransferase [Myceligenerans sp. TRM 65318]MBE3019141.1 GNAT family N-acetyltransferase [Myceligenerans sp. TRM 65318]